MGHYDDRKAGPFGPKRRQALAHLVAEALEWVREDGGPEHALPELFAEALTEVLERRGKLERPTTTSSAAEAKAEATYYCLRCLHEDSDQQELTGDGLRCKRDHADADAFTFDWVPYPGGGVREVRTLVRRKDLKAQRPDDDGQTGP